MIVIEALCFGIYILSSIESISFWIVSVSSIFRHRTKVVRRKFLFNFFYFFGVNLFAILLLHLLEQTVFLNFIDYFRVNVKNLSYVDH
mgnify:CR=1 FL=1|jgi:hypothetical protein